jgi:integrase/recombinase XerD
MGTRFEVARVTRDGRPARWGIDYRSPWDTDARGSRKRIKRFFRSKAERDQEAEDLEIRFQKWGATGTSELAPDQLADYQTARRMLPANVTLADAAAFYVRHHVKESPVFTEAIQAFLDAKLKANPGGAQWVSALDSVLKRFAAKLPDGIRLADVTAEHFQTFVDSFGHKAETKRNWRKMAHGAFAWFVKRRWARANPILEVEIPTVDRPAPAFLTVDQWTELLKAAVKVQPATVPVFILGGFAGIRSLEIKRMVPEYIHADRFLIDLPGFRNEPGKALPVRVTKSGKRRIMERILDADGQDRGRGLPPSLWTWLKAYPFTRDSVLNFIVRRRDVFKAAGIHPWPKSVLRHTFATYHISANQSADAASLIMGHEEPGQVLFEHYRGFATQEAGKAFFSVTPTALSQ